MIEGTEHLALFNDVDPATQAIDRLRALGVSDSDMTIISGVPFSERILGRPARRSYIPQIAIAGFLAGFAISLFLTFGTPMLYPIRVGGMPYMSIPTSMVLIFEISMLGLMIATFLGVIWESAFPSWGPKVYHPEVTDGKIAVVFNCPPEMDTQVYEELGQLGVAWLHRTEAKPL